AIDADQPQIGHGTAARLVVVVAIAAGAAARLFVIVALSPPPPLFPPRPPRRRGPGGPHLFLARVPDPRGYAQHALVQAQAALQLLHRVARGVVADQRVHAIAALADLVGQTTASPLLDVADRAALILDHAAGALDFLVDLGVFEGRVEDEDR